MSFLKVNKMETMISIIIPTYNRAHLIGETLDSVLAQTYKNWECIVVDDGSIDYTSELLELYTKKDSRIQYHHRPIDRKKGANACRNYGFELSKGEYIQWLDSDDILHFNYLEEKIRFILNVSVDVVISNTECFYDKERSTYVVFNNLSSNDRLLIDYITGKINLNTQSVLWKKKAVCRFDYNENIMRAQDLDFHFRILKEMNIKAGFIEKSLVFIRIHDQSLSGNYRRGVLRSILDEVLIRRNILKYVIDKKKFSSEEKRLTLKRYLKAFKPLITDSSINFVVQELKELRKIIYIQKHQYILWNLKLISLILIYKFSKRNYRLFKHLHKLEKSIL